MMGRLSVLDISFCKIGYKGIACIAEALERNESIQQLNIKGNPIRSCGAAEVIGHIAKNVKSKVEAINMNSCQIDNSFINALKKCTEIGNKLKTLELAVNEMGEEFVYELLDLYTAFKWKMRTSVSLRNRNAVTKSIAEAGCKNLIHFIM
eukprot:TRINITY_DN7926_c0_g4_i1.p2 TRINITY_DN7926_c0_g4~~TRINITY_DN7926_c0_g4_i1.p2  ORF type:complete len:150 (-),score=31.35 TRINITY_DN7926_c0_g4_i1:66-515(-)